ncbi:MAG: PD40 domain-containing protein [Chloroflexi bacterium]|nr:PD40 domain-containing protein [Chloroflexota bacterium]
MLLRLTLTVTALAGALCLALLGASAAAGAVFPGRELAYMSYAEINPDIFLIDLPRSLTRNLSDHPGYDAAPAWSPDGRWLAFVSDRDGLITVYLLAHGESQPRRLIDDGEPYTFPRWTRDSQQLVVRAPRQGPATFYLVNRDGSGLTLVQDGMDPITGREIDLGLGTSNSTQVRSPDGRLFAFMAFRQQRWSIFVSPRPHDAAARFLVDIGHYSDGLAWSPQSDWIAYTATINGVVDLFSVPLNGGPPQRLTSGRPIDAAPPGDHIPHDVSQCVLNFGQRPVVLFE